MPPNGVAKDNATSNEKTNLPFCRFFNSVFRSVRAVVTIVALSHERLTLSAAKLKKEVHLECNILASKPGSEFGGFGGSYLLKTYPSTIRRYTYFATPIQVL